MKSQVTLFLGIFSIMALSNAIVPVLPAFSGQSSWTGAIYSAYFLGAVISTLPSGILSDRYGRILLIQIGLLITVASGVLLSQILDPVPAVTLRLIEGIGAGLFVAPAMSCINSRELHGKLSGYFLALLNAGLVLGLVGAGLLATRLQDPKAGVILFTALSVVPAVFSLLTREPKIPSAGHDAAALLSLMVEYRGLWYATMILIGITGVVTSLFPKFSGATADYTGLWIAGMSIATIGAVLVVSRFPFHDILAIRISAVLMAAGTLLSFFSPTGLLILGTTAGIVMIAQMDRLSHLRQHQGIAMGLFSTMSYLGMALLPFLAGLVADLSGFFVAFCVTAVSALTVLVAARNAPGS
jgi:MFS family permease